MKSYTQNMTRLGSFSRGAALSALAGLLACGQGDDRSPAPVVQAAPPPLPALDWDRSHDDRARFLAGLPAASDSIVLEEELRASAEWLSFSRELDRDWVTYEKTILAPMREWGDRELDEAESVKTIFYPFSGPDFACVHAFFPKAEEYVLVGLEPAGPLPDFEGSAGRRSIGGYLGAVRRSLADVTRFNFFKTESLASDLRDTDLDGVLPLLLLFLARTGNEVREIRFVAVDEEGRLVAAQPAKGKGVEMRFVAEGGGAEQRLYYFSVNLSDPALARQPGFTRYLESLKPEATLLKSATYLLHKPYFSKVRNRIVSESQWLVQDDSGVPFRALDERNWELRLYGAYSRPIPMFADFYQGDLHQAYQRATPDALPFGIGYKHRRNQSNLLVGRRR